MSDFRSRVFRALGYDFCLSVHDRALGEYLAGLFEAFGPGSEEHAAEYRVRPAAQGARGHVLLVGDELIESSPSASALANALVQRLNTQVIHSVNAVVCHAGGVERGGVGFVFPAHMESGKTTLTAGLARNGFRYLTDEAVAFCVDTGFIDPYPKPLSIDPGSWALFPELAPGPVPGDDTPPANQWQVPPSAFGDDAVGVSCRAGFIVFPRYDTDAETALVPMGRAEALVELAKNTFEFRDRARRSLDALSRVVRDAQCFRMPLSSLDEACALIGSLAEGVAVTEAARG
jgi:hypothetical protein